MAKTIRERIESAIVVDVNGCWIWQLGISGRGYGVISIDNHSRAAHRVSYEIFVGPTEQPLDHLCRVRHCVNPEHLEPVTNRENLLRGETLAAENAAKTHCIRGHRFTAENTYQRKDRIGRECRACRASRSQERMMTYR